MTVSDYVWQYLADYTDTVFFLPGGGAMHLIDALARQSRIKPVAMLHEQAAGWAAIAYSQARQGLGVCLVTTGPGGTNAVTPCAAAWVDSDPVLFISGQVPTHMMMQEGERQRGPQEVEIVEITRPITKCATWGFVGDIKWNLKWCVKKALLSPRGPVWLDIPLDVQGAKI